MYYANNCNNPHRITNTFVDLNGVPYLTEEYANRNTIAQLDRSIVQSNIDIDNSEMYRSIIQFDIDDIGKTPDGYLCVLGNETKLKKLAEMTQQHAHDLNHEFKVLSKALIVVLSYELEDQVSGLTIRSYQETLRITDKNYFIDINPNAVNDNAIVSNFHDIIVSTVNQFVYGINRMAIRITNIQLYYECASKEFKPYQPCDVDEGGIRYNNYMHHKLNQTTQYIGITENRGPCYNNYPYDWCDFNRFYHFDNMGSDIVIHQNELKNPSVKYNLIPCGNIVVNRKFLVNPGQKLVFKFNIWKNDTTFVHDTTYLAKAIGAQCINPNQNSCDCGCDCDHDHPYYPPHHCKPVYPQHNHDNYTIDRYQSDQLSKLFCLMSDNKQKDSKRDELIDVMYNAIVAISRGETPVLPEEPATPDEGNQTMPSMPESEIQERIDAVFTDCI